eukprot:3706090-Amphidinium_carterae.1
MAPSRPGTVPLLHAPVRFSQVRTLPGAHKRHPYTTPGPHERACEPNGSCLSGIHPFRRQHHTCRQLPRDFSCNFPCPQ